MQSRLVISLIYWFDCFFLSVITKYIGLFETVSVTPPPPPTHNLFFSRSIYAVYNYVVISVNSEVYM